MSPRERVTKGDHIASLVDNRKLSPFFSRNMLKQKCYVLSTQKTENRKCGQIHSRWANTPTKVQSATYTFFGVHFSGYVALLCVKSWKYYDKSSEEPHEKA